ncbi:MULTISPECIES: type II secretion system minor pseudopilin GspK [unclassified Legionella]|uniref:type II secretion system minor pseudopilin GspK n=1 Tax=unclassified Legionella TaxID=2622702 RepID=UPI001E573010|nr:type II secretion system minor pseudopilin GspK [Legionella sp. 31fI33]
MLNRAKNKGSALISALFIMTLVAIAATAMSTRLQLDIYRTRLTINSDKLYLASQALSFWAMDMLSSKKISFRVGDVYGKISNFPTKLQRLYPEALIEGGLYDLQARFNLNNLTDKKYQALFAQLLESISSQMTPDERKELTLATTNWLMPYQPGVGNEFFSYYLRKKPGYYPSQQPMQSVSELRLIKGVNAKLYQRLFPYVIALPESTPININTAPKQLLMTLGNGLNEEQVNELLAARRKKGISDLKEIYPILEKLNIRSDQITVESQYFMTIATVRIGELSLVNYTIIKRNKDKQGKMAALILSESLNTHG